MQPVTKKIIIAEDDPTIAWSLKSIVDNYCEADIKICETGEDTVMNTFQNPPDLIFVNLKLEGEMNGETTAEYIRNYYDFPIIFLTGAHRDALKTYQKLFFPCIVLNKPFDKSQIEELLSLLVI